jgi:polar amino acid transport system permease protein
LAGLLHSIFNNPRFEWHVVAESFTEDSIISGVLMTLQLTAISVVLGFAGERYWR